MANFLIPTAIGIGANLLLSLFAPKQPTQERGKIEDTGVPTAEYGVSLSQPIGRVRKDGISMIWALPLQQVVTERGGKGGGPATRDYSYFMSAAFLIGGRIQGVRRVWMNSELVYSDATAGENSKNARFLEHCDIYTGSQTTPPSTILAVEGAGNVPSFEGWSLLVFDRYPIAEFNGSGFPRVDVKVVGELGDEPRIKDVLRYICNYAGIPDERIDTTDLNDDRIFGYDLALDGTSFSEQLSRIARIGMVIVGESGNRLIFRQQTRNAEDVYFIPKLSLGARAFGNEPVDLYEKKQENFRETPSSVTINYQNVFKDHDTGTIVANDPSADWYNDLSIDAGVVSGDVLIANTASRLLFLGRSQSVTYKKIYLLPAWNNIRVGDLISLDYTQNFHRETIQVTRKSLGAGYLIEIEGTRYQATANDCKNIVVMNLFFYTNPNNLNQLGQVIWGTQIVTLVSNRPPMRFETTLPLGQLSSTPTTKFDVYDADGNLFYTVGTGYGLAPNSTWGVVVDCTGVEILSGNTPFVVTGINNPYTPTETPEEPAGALAIPIETSLVNDRDTDPGFYVAIEGEPGFRSGSLFFSENGGASWEFALDVLSDSVVGEVLSFNSYFTSASPDFIDITSQVRVRLDSGDGVEPVPEIDFLAGKQVGLFGNELIAFKNVTVVNASPLTVDIDCLIRGVRGTEVYIPAHATGERFVLMTGYLLRLPVNLTDINRQVLLKVIPPNLAETEVDTETSHVITLESSKPFPPAAIVSRSDNPIVFDVTVSWFRRTQVGGQLLDYIDIPFAPGELDTYTVRVYNNAGDIVREAVTDAGAREWVYTAAMQLADWGSYQPSYTFRVFQNSGYPVAFRTANPVTG